MRKNVPTRPFSLYSIFCGTLKIGLTITTACLLFVSGLFLGLLISARWIDTCTSVVVTADSTWKAMVSSISAPKKLPIRERIEIPLNCSAWNMTRTCLNNYPTAMFPETDDIHDPSSSVSECPDYFRWIHEDLRPWKEMRISRDMVEAARKTAHFRLVIIDGKAYMEKYKKPYQTRDVFTLWGILQLLRRYPGKVPDLDLMFDCNDRPVIKSRIPPPLFRYSGDDLTRDIVFPDWSFWGWPEFSIKPWKSLSNDIQEGNKRTEWKGRQPYAYWKGNPNVAPGRKDLMKCNVSNEHDWNARLYAQDWGREIRQGFKQSNLADQCTHRYKIYAEGWAWSVSHRYILSCNSITLRVNPHYYDFFARSLLPLHHYWPVRDDDKCRSLKFAVDWGNSHKEQAQAIGEAASELMREGLKMDYVYDYMYHLLNEYAKLLTYKPTVPEGAVELCAESMICPTVGLQNEYMMESMEKGPVSTGPCTMPAYDAPGLQAFLESKADAIKQVEIWEKKYWENLNSTQQL